MTVGERGERHAAAFLRRKGYEIVACNYHTQYGEIDLICADARYIAFVEVKTRSSAKFGAPREAVTAAKQRKIILSAERWLLQHPTELQPRFDVVEVLVSSDYTTCRVNHIPDAFEVV